MNSLKSALHSRISALQLQPSQFATLVDLLQQALRTCLLVVCLFSASSIEAAMYKCQMKGRTVFQDTICPGDKNAQPYIPKAKLNTISSESMTGKIRQAPETRPSWLRPIDPIADCKAKGGTVDKEFRACMVP